MLRSVMSRGAARWLQAMGTQRWWWHSAGLGAALPEGERCGCGHRSSTEQSGVWWSMEELECWRGGAFRLFVCLFVSKGLEIVGFHKTHLRMPKDTSQRNKK